MKGFDPLVCISNFLSACFCSSKC